MPEPKKFLENFEEPPEVAPETPAAPPPAEVKPAPTAEPVAAPVEAEKPKVVEKTPEEKAYWKALSDEREKRRQLERDNAYWRGRAEATGKAAPQEDQKKLQQERENEFLTDPVNFTDRMIQERVIAAVRQDRWDRSIDSVQREHKDWPDARDGFLKLAEDDPALESRAMSHPDPARYVYEYMKQRAAAATPLDVEAERKKIRAEVEADLRKEMALSAAGATPPSLAGATGAGGSGSVEQTPDLNDLFKNQAY